MRLHSDDSREICFLRGDYTHVYWLCAYLYEDGVVVMDSKEDYYLVDPNLKKTYIGCNAPKDEKENLWYVMPRLGKKYHDEAMERCRKEEEKTLQILQEKSNDGSVEVYQQGKKWGIKLDGKVVVPPIYLHISEPVGAYCAFERMPRHWGVITAKGRVVVEAKYEYTRKSGIKLIQYCLLIGFTS